MKTIAFPIRRHVPTRIVAVHLRTDRPKTYIGVNVLAIGHKQFKGVVYPPGYYAVVHLVTARANGYRAGIIGTAKIMFLEALKIETNWKRIARIARDILNDERVRDLIKQVEEENAIKRN